MTTIFFHPSRFLLFLDPGWVKIRIRDKHPGSATLQFFGLKYLTSLMRMRIQIRGTLDPGFRMEKIWIRDKYPEFATILFTIRT
jgi:hypothetical protein